MHKRYFFSICLLILALSGCGNEGRKSITGKVLLDGQPLAGAMLSFVPDASSPDLMEGYAKTNDQGNFEMRTLGNGNQKGILPGKYIVLISKKESYDTGKKKPSEVMYGEMETVFAERDIVPVFYSDSQKTPLTAVVENGKNPVFQFELNSISEAKKEKE